jgi:hypothetical protein
MFFHEGPQEFCLSVFVCRPKYHHKINLSISKLICSRFYFYKQGIGNTGQGFANLILFCICTARTREIILSEVADIINKNTCMRTICPCRQCCLPSHDETKPLLPGHDNNDPICDLSVYFKDNNYDYTSSQSFTKSAQISYTYLK